MSTSRVGFTSLGTRGLNWQSFPMRLFVKGNAGFWNPAEIDMRQDAEDWADLSEAEQHLAATLCAQFIAGEEAVTQDLQPFMAAMAAEGRFHDELFLTQFCFEEAKHTEVFRRWLDAVGLSGDLHDHVAGNPGYRAVFYEALPQNLQALDTDPSPAAQLRASVTYNHVVEGVLALTGYYAWDRVCRSRGIFPGMQQIIKKIGDDERRHMAWGTFTCRRHVAADEANWAVVEQTMQDLLPHAVSQIEHVFAAVDEVPFDLSKDELVSYATDKGTRRLDSIKSAMGADLATIDTDASPEQLEERFHREDEAAKAARTPAGAG